jgi:hypothetical protein
VAAGLAKLPDLPGFRPKENGEAAAASPVHASSKPD